MTVGAYVITCEATGRCYVGGSGRSIENRLSFHWASLRSGSHYNSAFLRDYQKYGEANFKVEIYPAPDYKLEEQKWLDYFFKKKLAYNIHPKAESAKGTKFTEEQKAKQSEKAIARCTSDWRKEVSERVKKQHTEGKFGQHTWSDKTKKATYEKISAALNGHPSTRTKPITEESRERYRQAAKRREMVRQFKRWLEK